MVNPDAGGRVGHGLEPGGVDAAAQGDRQYGRNVGADVPPRPPEIGETPGLPESRLAPGRPDLRRGRRCQQVLHCPEQRQAPRRAAQVLLRCRLGGRAFHGSETRSGRLSTTGLAEAQSVQGRPSRPGGHVQSLPWPRNMTARDRPSSEGHVQSLPGPLNIWATCPVQSPGGGHVPRGGETGEDQGARRTCGN